MKRYFWGTTLVWLDRMCNHQADTQVKVSVPSVSGLYDTRSGVEFPVILPERFWSTDTSNALPRAARVPSDPEDRKLLEQQADLIRATIDLLK